MRATIIALAGIALALAACNPFKVTDPSDPRFQRSDFRLKNYDDEFHLNSALEILLPAGTSRVEVDNLLVSTADSYLTLDYYQDENLRLHSRDESKDYLVVYYAPDDPSLDSDKNYEWLGGPGWEVWVTYNSQDALKSFDIERMDYHYSEVQKSLLAENINNLKRKP